jgi:uncharacterized protein (DUF1919 family)
MATASQSLFNMTVASDNAGGNQGLLMPKLQFRFRVNFLNFGTDTSTVELTKQVIDCSRPQVQFTEITMPVYNSTMYLAGKYAWQTMSVNIRDDASGNVSRLVGQQLQKQLDFVEMASAASGQDYKFQTNIEILDGGNGIWQANILETWECYGCYVVSANYQNLSYSEATPSTIDLSIQPDNCIQTPQGSGVGANVGRTLRTMATGGG